MEVLFAFTLLAIATFIAWLSEQNNILSIILEMELKAVIHSTTAQICQDISSADRELSDPPHRRWARLLVIAAVGVLLGAATVVMAVRIPEFQTEKKTFSSKHPIDDLQQLLHEAEKKNQTVHCPCRAQVLSWCNMTTFHVYIGNNDEHTALPFSESLNITHNNFTNAYPDICGDDPDPTNMFPSICESVLTPIMNSDDSRTFLQTANAFTTPDALYKEIKFRIDTNSYEEYNTYNYLQQMNKTIYFNYSDSMTRLLRDMARQFLVNYSSSAEDFWRASEGTHKQFPSMSTLAFGMTVSWREYLQNCYPAFCDVEFKVSILNRMLRAMGQVGGVTTVISLAVKYLVWPSLRTALQFPTYKVATTA